MNIMSEFMGLIYGQYDAREEGFAPGGAETAGPANLLTIATIYYTC
jgi:hypothetical protein